MDKISKDRTKLVQNESYKLLQVFHDICEKENLKYILDYGTLLGAVRHQGFIPWDDDLDVAMPREDYEKFLEVAPNYLPDNMVVQNNDTEPNYFLAYTKLRKTDVNLQEKELNLYDISYGVWIDIFVYDPINTDSNLEEKKVHSILNAMTFLKYRFPMIYAKDKKIYNWPKALIKLTFIKILELSQKKKHGLAINLLTKKHRKMMEEIESPATSPSDIYVRCYQVGSNLTKGNREGILKTNSFNQRILLKFEGHKFYGPKNYDEVLSDRYGDYMKMPPESERCNTHAWTDQIKYKIQD